LSEAPHILREFSRWSIEELGEVAILRVHPLIENISAVNHLGDVVLVI
jgi:hypothetical protein